MRNNVFSCTIACFLFVTTSCKTVDDQSQAKLVKAEGASVADKITGIVDIMNWLDGRNQVFSFPANNMRMKVPITNGNLDMNLFLESNDVINQAYLDEFYSVHYMNFPKSYDNNSGLEFSQIQESVSKTLIDSFDYQTRVDLLVGAIDATWMPNRKYHYDLARSSTLNELNEGGFRLFSESETKNALESLLSMAKKNIELKGKYVRYNGQYGYYDYQNSELSIAVAVAAYNLLHYPKWTVEIVNKLNNKAEMLTETNTSSELSRVEPFDLISNMITTMLLRDVNVYAKKPELNKFVSSSMKKILKFDQPANESLLAVKHNADILSFCFQPPSTDKNPLISSDSIDIVHTLNRPEGNSSKICDGKIYTSAISKEKQVSLNRPKAFSKVIAERETIRVKAYVTLAKEISPWYIRAFTSVAQLNGFHLKQNEIVSSREHFDSVLSESDLMIYAGHILSAYKLDIGTTKNRSLLFEGRSNGKDIELEIILPHEGASVALVKSDLTESYKKRLAARTVQDPLFVFVTSCFSENNTKLWPLIHRAALKSDSNIASRLDLPYVIASDRSFGTSNSLEILSHVFYPLDVINKIAAGEDVDDIYNYLLEKEYGSLVEEAYDRVGPVGKIAIKSFENINKFRKGIQNFLKNKRNGKTPQQGHDLVKEAKEKFKFSPVYSFDEKTIDDTLNLGGAKLIFSNDEKTIYEFSI